MHIPEKYMCVLCWVLVILFSAFCTRVLVGSKTRKWRRHLGGRVVVLMMMMSIQTCVWRRTFCQINQRNSFCTTVASQSRTDTKVFWGQTRPKLGHECPETCLGGQIEVIPLPKLLMNHSNTNKWYKTVKLLLN